MEQLSTSTYRKWSVSEESLLKKEAKKSDVLNLAFVKVATQTGRSVGAVSQHYSIMHSRDSEEKKSHKKWTEEEEQRLIRQVRAFPQNLHKCFLIVSEELDRTPSAVATRWYHVLSKKPELKLFITASENNVSVNRKNYTGIESNSSVWRKIVRAINTLFK